MEKFSVKKMNSKGAVSIFLTMSILAAVLVIALGTSFALSTESKLSLSSGESVSAYYKAESGMEEALYDKINQNRTPRGNRCAGACPSPACGGWTCTENALGATVPYCIEITLRAGGDECDPNDILSVKSIGEYGSTRRSIEISF